MVPAYPEHPPGGEQTSPDPVYVSPLTQSRIPSLDILRGIAVLGGLIISIWLFGGFSINKQSNLLLHPDGGNYRLFSTVSLLFEGKMRALISLVFGAGMVIYLSKPTKENQLPVADLFIRRQMWLIAFGLVNALLFLWSYDILFHLGIIGILLFPFFRLSTRGLLIAAVLTTLIFCGKNYWRYSDDRKTYHKYIAVTAVEKKMAKDSLSKQTKDTFNKQKKDTLTADQKKDKEAWEGMVKNMKYDPKKDEGENKEMRNEKYGALWDHILPVTQSREAQWTYRSGIWDIASMILLGMALFKSGFFSNRFSGRQYLLLAIAGITAGLLAGWFRLYYNNAALIDYARYIRHHRLPYHFFLPLERLFSALGYASLVLALLRSGILAGLWQLLAVVGRMALTNYLMQSIICTLYFTGYGMGYFGKLEQYQLYLVVAETWLAQTVFSILWLKHFDQGPAEWLWRCLVYGKWLPIKKHGSEKNDDPIPATS